MQSLFLPAHISHSEVDVDVEHHEEEKELQVVVWTAQNSSLKLSICERDLHMQGMPIIGV